MEGDRQDNTVTTAATGSQQTVVRLELPKESPWKQPAVYVAALALIVALGGEWRRWVALDASNQKQHDYYEEINVWETDEFNHMKDIEELLKSGDKLDLSPNGDTDTPTFLELKQKPPPVPK